MVDYAGGANRGETIARPFARVKPIYTFMDVCIHLMCGCIGKRKAPNGFPLEPID